MTDLGSAGSLFIDGLVIAAYFGLILWIGLRVGEKDKTLNDFALGGHKIPWWAVLGSIIAAETSAGTFIGTPGEGFSLRNFTYLQLAFGTILARLLVSYTFIAPYYRYQVTSIYEFLTLRFGERSKNAASGVFLITRVLASGARVYVSAIILVVAYRLLSGLPTSTPTPPAGEIFSNEFWIYFAAILLITAVTALYTSVGGIKAVIWTDLIQASVMMGSALIAIYVLYSHVEGGWGGLSTALNGFSGVKLWDAGLAPEANAGLWTHIKSVLQSEYTIFAALIGSTFTTMATHGTDQDMVQRMLTAENPRKARLSLIVSGLADIPIVVIFLSIGILLWVFYQQHPDAGLPQKTNEVFCYFILKQMPIGVRGLLIAGIFATSMGSLSAALNALATSFIKDFYLPFINPTASAQHTLRAAKRATLVFAVFMVLVASATAFLVLHSPKSRIIPIALGIFGYTYGSLLGIFLLGILTKRRGNDRGNGIAMLAGFMVVAVLSGLPQDVLKIFGYTPPWAQDPWLVIEFPWRIFFGTIVTFAVAALFRSDKALPA